MLKGKLDTVLPDKSGAPGAVSGCTPLERLVDFDLPISLIVDYAFVASSRRSAILVAGMSNADAPQNENSPISLSEEKVRRATVGEPTVLNGPVKLVDYNPEWPRQFALEAERIRTGLGNRALRIEHVGSTSVPGLLAKPIIDILLVVADSAEEQS